METDTKTYDYIVITKEFQLTIEDCELEERKNGTLLFSRPTPEGKKFLAMFNNWDAVTLKEKAT
jgi:hypothetical protein